MLCLARHRYKSFVQLTFLAANAFGLWLGTMYNSRTPDLYPNNAHRKLGWTITLFAVARVVVGQLGSIYRFMKRFAVSWDHSGEREKFLPLSSDPLEEPSRRDTFEQGRTLTLSSNSDQGPELHTASRVGSLGSSTASSLGKPHLQLSEDHEPLHAQLSQCLPTHRHNEHKSRNAITMCIPKNVLHRIRRSSLLAPTFVDCIIPILGYIALCTGVIALGRLFVGTHQSTPSLCRLLIRFPRKATTC